MEIDLDPTNKSRLYNFYRGSKFNNQKNFEFCSFENWLKYKSFIKISLFELFEKYNLIGREIRIKFKQNEVNPATMLLPYFPELSNIQLNYSKLISDRLMDFAKKHQKHKNIPIITLIRSIHEILLSPESNFLEQLLLIFNNKVEYQLPDVEYARNIIQLEMHDFDVEINIKKNKLCKMLQNAFLQCKILLDKLLFFINYSKKIESNLNNSEISESNLISLNIELNNLIIKKEKIISFIGNLEETIQHVNNLCNLENNSNIGVFNKINVYVNQYEISDIVKFLKEYPYLLKLAVLYINNKNVVLNNNMIDDNSIVLNFLSDLLNQFKTCTSFLSTCCELELQKQNRQNIFLEKERKREHLISLRNYVSWYVYQLLCLYEKLIIEEMLFKELS